jgi:hypothetical protein
MDEKWYYVESGERKGPVELSEIRAMAANSALKDEDFIWKKGMENWTKLKDVSDISEPAGDEPESPTIEEPVVEAVLDTLELRKLAKNENSIFIKIGSDRGGANIEYGPYSIEVLKKLFKENRVNGKTFVFLRGMNDWSILGDFEDFGEIFDGLPPVIEEIDRRASLRKPFVARMFFESDKQVYVGICRDVSVGGMQVLVDHVPAPLGEVISINVHPENTEHHFVASGEVVRHLDGGQGFSFRFKELQTEAKQAIEKYITDGQNS